MSYDLIIIGAGPAGLAAAIYAARYKLKTLVLYKNVGGELALSPLVENYPGFKSITGLELATKMKDQAQSFGAELKEGEVIEINNFIVKTKENSYKAKSIILALGSERKHINVPGEKEFMGKGVAYCATCDAAFYRNKDVAIIGDGNSAITSAQLLTQYANKVYVVHASKQFRAEPFRLEQVKKNKKVEFICPAILKEIKGDKFVTSIITSKKEVKVQGVFIEVGSIPSTVLAKNIGVKLNKKKEIVVTLSQETNIPGIFAAGDTTCNIFKQATTAIGEGSLAAYSAYQYLQK